ncbi:MAG: cytochrome c biogenesis protein CcsA [Candidatus Adiutrix sp.]|jgi:ABC-type transport system involved in cytochrome c biogenesis permease subunit|nr:cytochrome c biogenesis protein CcsA [Candidatus Adiutrix sp.]
MTWTEFNYLAPPAVGLWWLSAAAVMRGRRRLAEAALLAGLAVFTVFVAAFWRDLGRPPMRTMGETRLWYSLFLSGAGYLAYRRWPYPWLLAFSALLASVFAIINLLKPEIHSQALMPALQSVYFIPHVTVYMLAYALLGVAAMAGLVQLRRLKRGQADPELYAFLDNVVYVGFGFLMLGLLSGAAWAKEAWGHYWSWDPKETWALVTASAYLLYIHMRLKDIRPRLTLGLLSLALLLLMITWLGVSYLPSAQGSVHVYS